MIEDSTQAEPTTDSRSDEKPKTRADLPEKKIAIVGFTASREEAPWGEDGWELWLCNNLWGLTPDSWHRLYDLHDLKTIRSDVNHEAFLRGHLQKGLDGRERKLGNRPVYCFEPQPEWPTATAFPKDEITGVLGRYFTNSISWMIAHALMEGVTELHIYGVDLATGGEYAAQRPSCEYLLGIAVGMGVRVHIPDSSDLLKLNSMYGAEDDGPFYAKTTEREKELLVRAQQLDAQIDQSRIMRAQVQGALETTRYFRDVWANPRATSRHEASSEPPVEAPAQTNGHGPPEVAEKALAEVG